MVLQPLEWCEAKNKLVLEESHGVSLVVVPVLDLMLTRDGRLINTGLKHRSSCIMFPTVSAYSQGRGTNGEKNTGQRY